MRALLEARATAENQLAELDAMKYYCLPQDVVTEACSSIAHGEHKPGFRPVRASLLCSTAIGRVPA